MTRWSYTLRSPGILSGLASREDHDEVFFISFGIAIYKNDDNKFHKDGQNNISHRRSIEEEEERKSCASKPSKARPTLLVVAHLYLLSRSLCLLLLSCSFCG